MYSETAGVADGTDVVLLHGGIGTGRYHWSKLVEPLGARYRLHLPDLPGHGHEPVPDDRPYSRDLLVDAVAEFLEAFDGPVNVAAFSMGGHASLRLLQDRPDLFASLTLVGVSIRDHAGLQGWRDRFDPDRLEREYPVWARALAKLHAPLGPDAWRDVCDRDRGGLDVTVDLDRLRGLDCPVLLVRGDRDPAVDPSHYAELRAVWDAADELVVPNGGHEVQLTRAPLVAPALLDFLDRAGA